MHTISRDTPALYITTVAKDRLPVFRTDAIKVVTCNALNEARESADFSIYAYVLMPDHLHAITDASLKPSKVLQYINGIISRRVIDHLKERGYRYSLWDHHSNVFSITSEDMFMEKVNYIHQNPVRAGLVERAEDCRWSSVRQWKGCPLEDEPLKVDIDRIAWSRGVAS